MLRILGHSGEITVMAVVIRNLPGPCGGQPEFAGSIGDCMEQPTPSLDTLAKPISTFSTVTMPLP
jgi:hypothetical protein